MNNKRLENYKRIARDIRKNVLKMHTCSKGSHIGSALSIIDILIVLYFHTLRIDPKNAKDRNRDRFILSKGHAVSALYAVLAKRGFFQEKILEEYCMNGGKLWGHSTRESVNGIEVSTGSLGHGLSLGVGMSLAAKYDKDSYRVFVLLSDGECNEGSVWESAMFAAHHHLSNLIAIIDYNKLQAFGRTNEVIDLEPFKNKWIAFGWAVEEIDGHNFNQLEKTLSKVPFKKNRPSVIIAHTVKGKGFSFMEDHIAWHYKSPSEEQFEIAIKEIEK